jgi:hypothetical protein
MNFWSLLVAYSLAAPIEEKKYRLSSLQEAAIISSLAAVIKYLLFRLLRLLQSILQLLKQLLRKYLALFLNKLETSPLLL